MLDHSFLKPFPVMNNGLELKLVGMSVMRTVLEVRR